MIVFTYCDYIYFQLLDVENKNSISKLNADQPVEGSTNISNIEELRKRLDRIKNEAAH